MSTKVLHKYDNYDRPMNMLFTRVENDVLTKGLDNTELGLYVFLKASASKTVIRGGDFRLRTTIRQISESLSWQRGFAVIPKMLKHLESCDLININCIKGKTIEIIFPENMSRILSDGYFKVYGHSLSCILQKSSGKQTLNYMGVYAHFRGTIFENSHSAPVYDKSPRYLAKICDLSESTMRNYFTWYRDNKVMAYFHVLSQRDGVLGYNKYIYADMHDCQKLVKYIDDGQYGSVITEVLE
ncbi:hypothetical protein [Limosilactobacillus reuteri]|uniref:hypothetical protein n=1 Tax=Limosilactobacillus reuteri TaxID=1598 RepID=UPI00081BD044|nr:hypothetical protein [Limosilactobacillus reuteri]MCH5378993.1 hypothetical protein [Limosilactobacillus reuteri]OCW67502.1 hypothetical protein BBP13_09050 [Limosilactobacillus reuteri]OCW69831.1 hypothetical protein BBP14_02340 [Limosilactobacillus reuteri]